jgi:hypothetical protein
MLWQISQQGQAKSQQLNYVIMKWYATMYRDHISARTMHAVWREESLWYVGVRLCRLVMYSLFAKTSYPGVRQPTVSSCYY